MVTYFLESTRSLVKVNLVVKLGQTIWIKSLRIHRQLSKVATERVVPVLDLVPTVSVSVQAIADKKTSCLAGRLIQAVLLGVDVVGWQGDELRVVDIFSQALLVGFDVLVIVDGVNWTVFVLEKTLPILFT